MTPKEKATELVNQYYNAPFNCKDCEMPFCDVPCTRLNMNEAKECALIAVDEILKISSETAYPTTKFWTNVKQEIEQL